MLTMFRRVANQHWQLINHVKTTRRYSDIAARLLKVFLISVKMGAHKTIEQPDTLGDREYRLVLTEAQIKAGQELLDAHKK